MIAKLFCFLMGHRDDPAGCRVDDGPFILTALVCRRCVRIEAVR